MKQWKVSLAGLLPVMVCTLALITPRPAASASIADLAPRYDGETSSVLSANSEHVVGSLIVATKRGQIFTGTLADGDLQFRVRGRVRGSRVSFSGVFRGQGVNLRITGSAALSATGDHFVGSATEQGTVDGRRVRDGILIQLWNGVGHDAPERLKGLKETK